MNSRFTKLHWKPEGKGTHWRLFFEGTYSEAVAVMVKGPRGSYFVDDQCVQTDNKDKNPRGLFDELQ